MVQHNEKLLENFPHVRVFCKAALSYVGLLAAVGTLKDVWKPADQLKTWLYKEDYAVPLLGIGFYALFLVVECIHRSQREEMEARRSSPEMNRKMRRAEESRRQRDQRRKK